MAGIVRTARWLLMGLCLVSVLLYVISYLPSSQPVQSHLYGGLNVSSLVATVQDDTLQSQQMQMNNTISVSETNNNSLQGTVAEVPKSEVKLKKVPQSNVSAASSSSINTDTTIHGVLASSIYEAGHKEPNPNICPRLGEGIRLLILIMSAPAHIAARQAIRQTWGHYTMRRDVSIAFMLGLTRNETKLEKNLTAEQNLYSDLIRGRFIDTYNNLTLKTISMLEWVNNYCPKTNFILKTDDDMFINVEKLLAFVQKQNPKQRVIYGRLARKWKPIRNTKSKYYVSPQQYAAPVFPDFTTGPAYLISSCAVRDLYSAALNHTYLKLEDVFTTGIVAHDIGVRRVYVNEFLNKRIAFNPCNVQKGISIHMVKNSEQLDLWKKLLDGKTKCK